MRHICISKLPNIFLIGAFVGTLAAFTVEAEEIRTGEALIQAMHDRYRNNWYETVTFTQKSTAHKPDGTNSSEIWHEAAMLPGKLRIDIGAPSEGTGTLIADGMLTSFKDGQVTRSLAFVHELLVLGFDVYRQDPQITIDQLKEQGFDLARVHEDTWEGHAVYVVGATAKQFWVEKERLLFVRLMEPDRRDKAKRGETRFTDYRQLRVGWIAARVEFYSDGKNVFTEKYSEIEANPKLDPAIFDAKQFGSRHWEK